MLLKDLFDPDLFTQMQAEGMVREQTHPYSNQWRVLNYTQLAQYSKTWNPVTTQCRGLIVGKDYEKVLARPWPKFFNWDDTLVGKIPIGSMIMAPKFDGSLGILYETPDMPGGFQTRYAIASRGSFDSEQARWGTKWFSTTSLKTGFFPKPDRTYLFEIVYAANRIVVDYHGYEGLVLLDVLNNESGLPDFEEFDSCFWPDKAAKQTTAGFDAISIGNMISDEEEGFVCYWPFHDLRVKIKGATYVHLHRIITNCTARTVWDYLQSGRGVEELLDSVPDEFMEWVRETVANLKEDYTAIEESSSFAHHRVKDLFTRKEQAIALKDFSHKSVVFKMLDGKPYDDLIWKMIKPAHAKPFWNREVEEAA